MRSVPSIWWIQKEGLSNHLRHFLLSVAHALHANHHTMGGCLNAAALQVVVFGAHNGAANGRLGNG